MGRSSLEVIEGDVGLHRIFNGPSNFAAQRVRHDVDSRACIDEHPANWLAVDETLHVKRLKMLIFLVNRLFKNRSSGAC